MFLLTFKFLQSSRIKVLSLLHFVLHDINLSLGKNNLRKFSALKRENQNRFSHDFLSRSYNCLNHWQFLVIAAYRFAQQTKRRHLERSLTCFLFFASKYACSSFIQFRTITIKGIHKSSVLFDTVQNFISFKS